MFEKFLSQNARDFAQRYEGTYGFFRDAAGKRTLCRLEGIGDRALSFLNAAGSVFKLNADATDDIGFEFLPPKPGFYNTDLGAMLVQRVAARQFQRGVSHRNVTITLYGGDQQKVSFPTLERVYEKALSPVDALPLFESTKVPSLALSSQLCLVTGYVYLFSEFIGTYSRKEKEYTITLKDKSLFRTELTDAFKTLGREVTFN